MSKLTIFTNTYPYGTGETFLHEELPIVAEKFTEVIIFPLYIPQNVANNTTDITKQLTPTNVTVMEPLIGFDHKDKKNLITNGIIPKAFFMEIVECFKRGVFLSGKKFWIFCNYTLLFNSILNNKGAMLAVKAALIKSDVAYFYWGDKSALIIPYLKKKLKKAPHFVVRFHGSDIYEEAKGYLPYRDKLYKAIDYAVPISKNGAEYIKQKYPNSQPQHIEIHRLGSYEHEQINTIGNEIFHIVSCSNVIELKRIDLIAKALLNIEKDFGFIERMEENGYKKIKWTHIGAGPLLDNVKQLFKLGSSIIIPNFKGYMVHTKVIEFYNNTRIELFTQVSRSEGIPVSIMEAMSYGIPIIATNVGGVSELFSNSQQCEYGTLLPKDITAIELENAIKKFILLPDSDMEHARATARTEWETNWNSQKNYSKFADFLVQL
ncbi:MAG: glycosyltransferase [Bacteroidales bacterium]